MITDEKGRRVLSISQRRYISLQAQRDELIAALREIEHSSRDAVSRSQARMALAKVTP